MERRRPAGGRRRPGSSRRTGRGGSSPRGAWRPSIIALRSWAREALGYVLDVVAARGCLRVRPVDAAVYLGVRDHGAAVRLGRVLVLLREAGLAAYSHSPKVRPKRYRLVPRELWRRFAEECNRGRFRCESGVRCPLVGTCPYWRLLEHLGYRHGDGGRG